MAVLHVEKLGGLANFGGAKARIRSRGKVDTKALSAPELEAVNSLFEKKAKPAATAGADSFRYRISRTTDAGTETVEVAEAHVPSAVASSVKDELV